MQEKESPNPAPFADIFRIPEAGRIVSLDIGTRNVGVAVCDEIQMTARPVRTIKRTNWKALLGAVREILSEFDAVGLVLGLPLSFDGSDNDFADEVRRLARNFSLSLAVPVALYDERVSSIEARERLHGRGYALSEIFERVDSEAAAVILGDFLELRESRRRSA